MPIPPSCVIPSCFVICHTGNQGLGYTGWVIDTGVHFTHVEFGNRAQQVVNFAGGANVSFNSILFESIFLFFKHCNFSDKANKIN